MHHGAALHGAGKHSSVNSTAHSLQPVVIIFTGLLRHLQVSRMLNAFLLFADSSSKKLKSILPTLLYIWPDAKKGNQVGNNHPCCNVLQA